MSSGETPLPAPVVTKSHVQSCPYATEVGAIRAWRRMYPVLTTILATLIMGVGVHSCQVSRDVGVRESDIRHLAARQQEQSTALGSIQAVIGQQDDATQGERSQILIQLGRMEARLDSMGNRLERVETAVMPARRPGG